jgi:hypothetical protein
MGSRYQQLNMDERNRLHRGLNQGMSLRALPRCQRSCRLSEME